MSGVTELELQRRKAVVLAACVDQVLARPIAEITIKSVVEASGLPGWAAYRAAHRIARNREHLIRRAVDHLADQLCQGMSEGPGVRDSVLATMEAWVARMAEVMQQPRFAAFFAVVVCQGAHYPWLAETYERRIAAAFCSRIEAAVQQAGRAAGVAVFFRDGAPRRILRQLESALVLPPLLPGGAASAPPGPGLVAAIAREAFQSSHAWHLEEVA
jgi:hypothetical protein